MGSVIVIVIDPDKGSHSACAVDARREIRAVVHVEASASGYRGLFYWAQARPERRWAIEGAQGLGRHLARSLLARGESVVDVPSTLSARVRELTRAERKTDGHDALATATAAIAGEPRPVSLETPRRPSVSWSSAVMSSCGSGHGVQTNSMRSCCTWSLVERRPT